MTTRKGQSKKKRRDAKTHRSAQLHFDFDARAARNLLMAIREAAVAGENADRAAPQRKQTARTREITFDDAAPRKSIAS